MTETLMNALITEITKDILMKHKIMISHLMTDIHMRGVIKMIILKKVVFLIGITKIVNNNTMDLLKISSLIKMLKTIIDQNL